MGSQPSTELWTWPGAQPVDPGEGLDAGWAAQFPLLVEGRQILTQQGQRFRLRGVNWYGASDIRHVVGGLDVQKLEVICESIRDLGFNVVRLPFSNEMLRSAVREGSIDLERNPTLKDLSALEVLDEVVRSLGRHRIAVVLNNHTTYGEWCGGPDKNGLWFDPGSKVYTAEQWMEDWAMLATRYRSCPQVVGFDLRNEVRFCPRPFRWPAWNVATLWRCLGACDWAVAAAACIERINLACPARLVVVERIIWPMRSLHAYAARPGPLLPQFQKQLVLGVHHYSWNGPGRYLAFGHHIRKGWKGVMKGVLRALQIFSKENYGDMCSERLKEELGKQWGYLLDGGTCPVWVSEFGSVENPSYDLDWFAKLARCMGEVEADFAYWPLNVGPKPGSGGDEIYGFLNKDWRPKPAGDARLSLMVTHGLLPCRNKS